MDLRHYRSEFCDAVESPKEPPHYPTEAHAENPANRFRYEDYDWDGFAVEGQVTIILTQGFFTFVGEEDAERLKGREVCVSRKICPETGESIKVRAVLKENGNAMPLHRFLMDARKGDIIDHVNNLPLDNRRLKNLWNSTSSWNNFNRFSERKVNPGLKRGVKPRGSKFRGQIQFEGKTYFSELLATEDEAHAWYLAKFKELHGVSGWISKPERSLPIFPPLKPKAFCAKPVGTVVESIADTF